MINFSNAVVVDYSHSHKFWGENFRYCVERNLNIEGKLYALDNVSGVAPIWSGIDGLVNSASDYSDIVLNGVHFGPGRISNLSLSESNDVRIKNYSISVTTFTSGNLFNMSGALYSNLDFNNPDYPAYLLESFNEDFSYSSNESKVEEWNQSINLKFLSGAANGGNNNPKEMAKNFASGLFTNSPGYLLFGGTNAYQLQSKKYFKESYNDITNECSFSFDQKIRPNSDPYIFIYTHSVDTNEEGITTTQENGKIQGVVENLYTSAKQGYSDEFGFSYSRCADVFNAYKPNGALDLHPNYISLGRQDNKFEGTVDYNVVYSNDPKINDGYSWEYTQEIDRKDDCIYDVLEKGKIIGLSTTCSQADKYSNALAAWGTIKPGIAARSNTFYQNVSDRSKPLNIFSQSETKSAFEGTIEYDQKFTDDPTQNINGFKKLDVTIEDSFPVAKVAKFQVLGVKEIVQPQNSSTEGQRSLSLKLRGYKTTPLNTYLTFAKDFANLNIPVSINDIYINNCKYTWSPTEANFSFDLGWVFFGTKAFVDVTL